MMIVQENITCDRLGLQHDRKGNIRFFLRLGPQTTETGRHPHGLEHSPVMLTHSETKATERPAGFKDLCVLKNRAEEG